MTKNISLVCSATVAILALTPLALSVMKIIWRSWLFSKACSAWYPLSPISTSKIIFDKNHTSHLKSTKKPFRI